MALPLQTTVDTDNPHDLLDQLREFSIVSIGIIVYDGQNYTTHQVGMNKVDMLMASHLWQRFADRDYGNEREH